jgi:hypothetical protein
MWESITRELIGVESGKPIFTPSDELQEIPLKALGF